MIRLGGYVWLGGLMLISLGGYNSQEVNVAQEAVTSQTANLDYNGFNWTSDKAVDGCLGVDDADNNACCSSSNANGFNAWMANFNRQYIVTRIVVVGRSDDGGDQLQNFMVKVQREIGGVEEDVYNNTGVNYMPGTFTIPMGSTNVASVNVQRNANILTICEVEIYAVCDPGSYGANCAQTCGNCVNNEACDVTSGTCPSTCAAGWQGSMCDQPCAVGNYGLDCSMTCGPCVNQTACRPLDGVCTEGCAAGWHGDMCDVACDSGTFGENCNQTCGNCVNNEACDVISGTCPSTCSAGWQGSMCDEPCSGGMYGLNCSMDCGPCVNQTVCRSQDGVCTEGCAAGWHGDMCDVACKVFTKCVEKGNFVVCDPGTFGEDCNQTCGYCIDNEACNVTSGTCPSTCLAGWQGSMCSEPCLDGNYGLDCNMTCGPCLNPAACRPQDGVCTEGCAPGWYGDMCDVDFTTTTPLPTTTTITTTTTDPPTTTTEQMTDGMTTSTTASVTTGGNPGITPPVSGDSVMVASLTTMLVLLGFIQMLS